MDEVIAGLRQDWYHSRWYPAWKVNLRTALQYIYDNLYSDISGIYLNWNKEL